MEHTNTFMGITTMYNPVKHRHEMVRRAEQGLITGRALWAGLKASWYEMDESEKKEELNNC